MSRPVHVDVAQLDAGGASGAVWSLPHEGDLDANVVVLSPGDRIDAHVNDEVDVIIVGLAGHATVTVDGEPLTLGATSLILVPRHASRSIEASRADGVTYLTVHRARQPLGIRPRSRDG